ncbi:glycosyltransferase family 2 protein [Tardiphaga sp.]|uniref:glycosyltransferase family 2 protein n=1 Tax=Tardiphaga sp. TaxID=1926292 RepID=UPI00261A246C|nr:glycosyltransferase family 2 protein [Tardiphaga sp.]MDB5615876.1 glycosyltransferase [Tardiphaga sp.]
MSLSQDIDCGTAARQPGTISAAHPDRSPVAVASIVIPVFNSKASLPRLVDTIAALRASSSIRFEIILVDDASTDGSAAALRDLQKQAADVVVVEMPINRGQSKATTTGVLAARHDVVITLDDDLQHQPEDILRLLEQLLNATPRTLVIGVAESFKRPLWRGLAALGCNLISNLFLAKAIPLQLTTFCAFRRQLCFHLDPKADPDFALITEMVQAADRIVAVPVQLNRSAQRKSRYTLRTLLRLFLSRSRCYSLSRVLTGLVGILSVMTVSAALWVADGAPVYSIVGWTSALMSAPLAGLAVKVQRDRRTLAVTRADRPV